jgi:nitrogen fixation/metabolism regulation signal transduction histidine kinase
MQENDTMTGISQKSIERNFKDIVSNLATINKKIQDARLEKEQKQQYLQAVVDYIGIGLITFDETGNIHLINKASKEILDIYDLRNIDQLMENYRDLASSFREMENNEQKLIKLKKGNSELSLFLKAGIVKINESKIKLISFHNIKSELEIQELDSWRKLIQILRHEIMNSITPITTLTASLKRSIKSEFSMHPEIHKDFFDDTIQSVELVEERGKGLISFVEKFRSLTELPKPHFINVGIIKLFEDIKLLFYNEFKEKGISLLIETEEDSLKLIADKLLIEQVLINLVKNSIEAISTSKGTIKLKAFRTGSEKICIQVIDNGKGIKKEDLNKIFIPSFTTKKNGNGIGLSISKQILVMHRSTITAISNPNDSTIFELLFY